jgi:hypothetical protein
MEAEVETVRDLVFLGVVLPPIYQLIYLHPWLVVVVFTPDVADYSPEKNTPALKLPMFGTSYVHLCRLVLRGICRRFGDSNGEAVIGHHFV